MPLKAMHREGVAVITLTGDIDMEDVVSIKNLVTTTVADGCYSIVLDFSRVQHINATGIGILADRLRFVRTFHGDIRLAGLSPYLHNVFELTGVRNVFRIFGNADQAVRSFVPAVIAA